MLSYRSSCTLPFVACSSLQCTNMSLQTRQIQSHGISHDSQSVLQSIVQTFVVSSSFCDTWLACQSVSLSQSRPTVKFPYLKSRPPIHSILTEVPCWFLSLSRNVLGKWVHHKQHQDRFPVHPIMILPIIPPSDSVAKYSDHEPVTKYGMHT